jgi:predicted nucleotidyltransferase
MEGIAPTKAFLRVKAFYEIQNCNWIGKRELFLSLRKHELEKIIFKNSVFSKQNFSLPLDTFSDKEKNEIKENRKVYLEKFLVLKKYLWILSLAPFSRMFLLAGSLACGNPKEKSDIDLIIVAQHNYVWLNRFFLEVIVRLLGKRRRGVQKKNNFCFSYSFENQNPTFKNKDFVSAHFYKHIIPVWHAKETNLKQFWRANSWITNYAPLFPLTSSELVILPYKNILGSIRKILELILIYSGLAYLLEKLTKSIQERYIIKTSRSWSGAEDTRLILEKNCIYYHFPYSPWVRKRDILQEMTRK